MIRLATVLIGLLAMAAEAGERIALYSGAGFHALSIDEDAPPMFLVAATDDQLGLAPESIRIYERWLQAGKPVELHLYAQGGHGFGMRSQNLPSDSWIDRFGDWLSASGLIDPR